MGGCQAPPGRTVAKSATGRRRYSDRGPACEPVPLESRPAADAGRQVAPKQIGRVGDHRAGGLGHQHRAGDRRHAQRLAAYTGTEADRGAITPGRCADLILVDGELTLNIADMRRVASVTTQGRWLVPREVHEAIDMKTLSSRRRSFCASRRAEHAVACRCGRSNIALPRHLPARQVVAARR